MSISIFRGSAGPGILRSAGFHRFPSLSRSDIAAQDWLSGRGLPRLYDKSNTASVSTGGRCRTLNTNDDAGGRYRISSSPPPIAPAVLAVNATAVNRVIGC